MFLDGVSDITPSLFFVLRKADVKDLVSETVKESKKELLKRSGKKSSRNILFRLTAKGKLEWVSRGVYRWVR